MTLRLYLPATVRALLMLAAAAVTLWIAWGLLPTSRGLVGYDYNYYLPYLLAGEQWTQVNGWLAPAHFTPAFCGGMPWLANPESMMWSLPQILFNALGPIGAVRWTFAAMAFLGAAGTWLLLRRSFQASADAATLGAILFLLNGFLTYRMAIGHLTYYVVGLIPVLALLILWDSDSKPTNVIRLLVRGIVSAGMLAIMVFAGAPNFVIPALLSVVAIMLMQQALVGPRPAPWLLLAGACLWSIPLAAIKLAPAAIFILQYPRTYLNSGLFAGLPTMLDVLLRAFVFPGTLPANVSMGPGRIVLGKHEFEYGVTIVPVLLLTIAAVFAKWHRPRYPGILACLFITMVFPLVLSVGGQRWEHILASIPIINNNTVMTRWWAIEILPVIVAGALSLDRITRSESASNGPWRQALLTATAVIAMLQSADRPTGYYTEGLVYPLYQPSGVAMAHAAMKAGGSLPPIGAIGPAMARAADEARAPMDGLLRGDSSLPCYEAVFGYHSEWLPRNGLVPGPIDQIGAGLLNIADPRCYLTPRRSCHPGARLPAKEAGTAVALTHYRPIPWEQPYWQTVATFATCVASGISLFLLVLATAVAVPQLGRLSARR